MSEVWKNIIGYEGLYMISDAGRVKSLSTGKGNQYTVIDNILKQRNDKYGYLRVGLTKSGKQAGHLVHRLVAQSFIPNPNNLPQVNHKNGIKTDNTVENLEWCDSFYNQKHRHRVLGQITHNRKLNKEQVFSILSRKKESQSKLADEFKVSIACIKAVKSGRNYNRWYREFFGYSVDELVGAGVFKIKEVNND